MKIIDIKLLIDSVDATNYISDYSFVDAMYSVDKRKDFHFGGISFIHKEDEYYIYYGDKEYTTLKDIILDIYFIDSYNYINMYLSFEKIVKNDSIEMLLERIELDYKNDQYYIRDINNPTKTYKERDIKKVINYVKMGLPFYIESDEYIELQCHNINGKYTMMIPYYFLTNEDIEKFKQAEIMELI